MANNYLQFSCSYSFNSSKDTEIFNKLVEEIQFIHDHDRNADNMDALAYLNGTDIESKRYQEIKDGFKVIDSLIDEDSCNEFGFDMKTGSDANNPYAWVWFSAWEYGNVGNLGELMQEFFIRANSDDIFTMTWSETCSKLREDEFSGGSMTVTKDKISMMPCEYYAKKKLKRKRLINQVNKPEFSFDPSNLSVEENNLWVRYILNNNDFSVLDELISIAKRKNNSSLLACIFRMELEKIKRYKDTTRKLIDSVGDFLLESKNQ